DLQVVLFFALLLVFAGAERVAPRWPGRLDRLTRWPTNFLLTAVNLAAMSVLPVSLVSASLWASEHGWGLLNQARMPPVVLIAVTLLVRGFVSYATHYLMHTVPIFWRVHRVHHLDTELDVSTTVRFHPLEFVIQLVPGVLIVVAFGLTPWVLMFYPLV